MKEVPYTVADRAKQTGLVCSSTATEAWASSIMRPTCQCHNCTVRIVASKFDQNLMDIKFPEKDGGSKLIFGGARKRFSRFFFKN